MQYFGFNGFHGLEGGYALASIILVVAIVILCISATIGILSYIFESLGVFVMAKRRGLKKYGWAWVPVISGWVVGCLADQFDRKERGKDIPTRKFLLIGGIILLAMEAVYFAVVFGLYGAVISAGIHTGFQGFQGSVGGSAAIGGVVAVCITALLMSAISIAYSVFMYIALYKVYKSCKPSGAVVLLVFSIIFNVVIPFALFALRNKDDGYVMVNERQKNSGGADSSGDGGQPAGPVKLEDAAGPQSGENSAANEQTATSEAQDFGKAEAPQETPDGI